MTTETEETEATVAEEPDVDAPAEDSSWEALIAEEAAIGDSIQATVSPETYLQEGEILNRPSGEVPLPLRVSELRYKGYVQVWDTVTGDESLQPYWLLWQTMSKRRPDGSLIFTRTNPQIPRDYGQDLFCPLNPEAPDDVQFAGIGGMGFKSCPKRHIPYMDALYQHLRRSHKRAWDAIESARVERERQEGLSLTREAMQTQNRFMEALMANSAGVPLDTEPGEAPVYAPDALDDDSPAGEPGLGSVSCPKCPQTYGGTFGAYNLERHMEKGHSSGS